MSDAGGWDLQRPGAVATRFTHNPAESVVFYTTRAPQIVTLERTPDGGSGGAPRDGGRGGGVPDDSRLIGAPGADRGCCPPPPPPPGVTQFVATPSQFAQMRYDDMDCVYGIRVDNYLTKVSPANVAYKDAQTCEGWSALAACGDEDQQGWLYYASKISGDQSGAAFLTQFDLSQGDVNVNLPTRTAIDPTYLSSIYLKSLQTRWIVYQMPSSVPGADNTLRCIEIQRNQPATNSGPIMPTDTAISQTPTTIVSNGVYVFLYFVAPSGQSVMLRRAQRRIGDSPDQWTTGNVSSQPFVINTHLQISSVCLPNGRIRIFQENPNPQPNRPRFRFIDDSVPTS